MLDHTDMENALDVARSDDASLTSIQHISTDSTAQPENKMTWIEKITQQGPWDEATDSVPFHPPALPMPVEIASPSSLAPFFAHINDQGTTEALPGSSGVAGTEMPGGTKMLEFERGVLYADGRLDLCKQVVGPPSIGELMEALRGNNFVRHFLLGNNICGPAIAKAIGRFIEDRPYQMETWYLAGNCIDTKTFGLLADKMWTSPVITNIWLKRNPLGPGSVSSIFLLLVESPCLRTLDLDQTELGDAGVANLFSKLAAHDRPLALRNIYLNATGIGKIACQAISGFLSSRHCKLESLYMSCNPIGTGIAALAPGLKACHTLQRLTLQSCGLQDEGTTFLLASAIFHPNLRSLDLGQAYATDDLNARYNWLSDKTAEAMVHVINSTKLQYLKLSHQPMSQSALSSILEAVLKSSSLLYFDAKPLIKGGKSHDEVKAGQLHSRLSKEVRTHLAANVDREYGMSYGEFEKGPKRYIKSPEDVRYIDSVYRNRDAGMARRGLKVLEKHWEEGDETLERVMEVE